VCGGVHVCVHVKVVDGLVRDLVALHTVFICVYVQVCAWMLAFCGCGCRCCVVVCA